MPQTLPGPRNLPAGHDRLPCRVLFHRYPGPIRRPTSCSSGSTHASENAALATTYGGRGSLITRRLTAGGLLLELLDRHRSFSSSTSGWSTSSDAGRRPRGSGRAFGSSTGWESPAPEIGSSPKPGVHFGSVALLHSRPGRVTMQTTTGRTQREGGQRGVVDAVTLLHSPGRLAQRGVTCEASGTRCWCRRASRSRRGLHMAVTWLRNWSKGSRTSVEAFDWTVRRRGASSNRPVTIAVRRCCTDRHRGKDRTEARLLLHELQPSGVGLPGRPRRILVPSVVELWEQPASAGGSTDRSKSLLNRSAIRRRLVKGECRSACRWCTVRRRLELNSAVPMR